MLFFTVFSYILNVKPCFNNKRMPFRRLTIFDGYPISSYLLSAVELNLR